MDHQSMANVYESQVTDGIENWILNFLNHLNYWTLDEQSRLYY